MSPLTVLAVILAVFIIFKVWEFTHGTREAMESSANIGATSVAILLFAVITVADVRDAMLIMPLATVYTEHQKAYNAVLDDLVKDAPNDLLQRDQDALNAASRRMGVVGRFTESML